jgi:Fic family protein
MAIHYHHKQFPPNIETSQELNQLLRQARTELGRYDGFLSSMANPTVLLSPLFTQEAVLSSKIEGTQSTLSEVLQFEAGDNRGISEEKKGDIQEILNYRYAMNKAVELMNDGIPLSQRVLKQSHKVLMQGVRGANKAPGKYRKIPVWIGGTNIETARFVPLEAQHIPKAMGRLENYLHKITQVDELIVLANLHVEFEAIHPFLDGNGRVGRLLIPLYLQEKGLLSTPSFYISQYLEKNRDTYYDLLLGVSKAGDWHAWWMFFIQGVIEQAQKNFERATKITLYYQELKASIPDISKSPYGITALDFIFQKTWFNSTDFYKQAQIPKPTAQRLLKVLAENDILEMFVGGGRTPNFYIFKKLIDIADGK